MQPPYTSNRRLYLTKEGKLCEAKDPNRATLLVGEGGALPYGEAKRLGLLDEKPKAPEAARKNARRGGD